MSAFKSSPATTRELSKIPFGRGGFTAVGGIGHAAHFSEGALKERLSYVCGLRTLFPPLSFTARRRRSILPMAPKQEVWATS